MCIYKFGGLQRPEEGVEFLKAGVTGSSELPNVGAGNQTQSQRNNNKFFYPLTHLPSLLLSYFYDSISQCILGQPQVCHPPQSAKCWEHRPDTPHLITDKVFFLNIMPGLKPIH